MLKNIFILFAGLFLFILPGKSQTVTDIDGNIYNTITIGAQIWMKENLKATHFNNGDFIPTTTLPVGVDSASLFQWPYNDDGNNVNIYGRLYTWYTVVNSNNVCPAGWHVPSDSEWLALGNFLGGDTVAGDKLKEAGTIHWLATESTVDNSSSFTALPGGFRGNPTNFINMGLQGVFWSATPWGSSAFQRAYCFILKAENSSLSESVGVANCGMSVRCLKNSPSAIEDIHLKNEIEISPNPATTTITVSVDQPGNRTISMYNLLGTLIIHKNLTSKSNVIDIAALANGIYIIRIIGTDGITEQKLIKE